METCASDTPPERKPCPEHIWSSPQQREAGDWLEGPLAIDLLAVCVSFKYNTGTTNCSMQTPGCVSSLICQGGEGAVGSSGKEAQRMGCWIDPLQQHLFGAPPDSGHRGFAEVGGGSMSPSWGIFMGSSNASQGPCSLHHGHGVGGYSPDGGCSR